MNTSVYKHEERKMASWNACPDKNSSRLIKLCVRLTMDDFLVEILTDSKIINVSVFQKP